MGKLIDLTGKQFGRLTVLERDLSSKRTAWKCICECGNIKTIQKDHLLSGATLSCGCFQKEMASKANRTHGKSRTPLYNRWKAIQQRCKNPNDRAYSRYGGRGVTVCKEWCEYELFEKWSIENGYKPGLELDRIDNDNGYHPDNCRWTTARINNQNRRNTSLIDGTPLQPFAEAHGMTYERVHYIYHRLKKSGQEITEQTVIAYANQLPHSSRKREKV